MNTFVVVSKEDNIKNNLVEENGIRDLSPEITSCTPGPSQSISSKQYFDNSSVVHSTLNKTSTSSLESGSGASVFQTPSLPRKNKTSNIKVAVRCRPMLQNEINSDEMSVVDVDEGHVIVALKKSFKFDINLDKDVEQERVYELCVHPVVEKVSVSPLLYFLAPQMNLMHAIFIALILLTISIYKEKKIFIYIFIAMR